jgi:hypothetical protein
LRATAQVDQSLRVFRLFSLFFNGFPYFLPAFGSVEQAGNPASTEAGQDALLYKHH